MPSRRTRVALVVAAAALLFLLFSLRGIAGFYTDYLWFDSLGVSGVWSGLLSARIVPAVVFTIVFFVILLANLIIADRLAPRFVPAGPEEEFVQRYREVIGPYAGRVRIGVALLFAIIAGGGVSARWHDWILFRNRVDFGIRDPQFDTDVGFYVFQLPFQKFLFEWTFAALIIVFLVTAVAHYLNGGIRIRSPFEKVTPAVKAHLSVLLAAIALVRAAGYWFVERYELTLSTRGAVHGAGYTDVKAQLPAIHMLIGISIVAAILFVVNIRRRGWVLPVLGVGLWAFVSLVIGQVYPAFIQRFQVEPNELSREAPYIERNIEATRAAFGLDEVEVRDFAYEEDLTAADIEANEVTVNNARLWDPQFLPDTYKQLQRIRNFYDFSDVDIDRYVVDDTVVQTVLAARELNVGELPAGTWVNRHLVFTHGYGIVMSPAAQATPNGEPEFLLQDIPPEGDQIDLDRPEIYYGENMDTYAIVRTKEREFDYPTEAGQADATTRYEAESGVAVNSFLRKAAFGLRFADMKFFVSGELGDESRVLFERDIRDRVEKAAPFLRFDADPYPVVLNGRVLWVLDAYTATDNYPYSQAVVPDRLPGGSDLGTRLNYVRNSVKATVDAYTGDVTFYVIDERDPIVRAYRSAFPELFTDADEMPDGLRAHLRYPEDLFRVQTDLYATYHVTEPRRFYNRSDQWAIANDPGSGTIAAAPTPTPVDGTRTTVTAGGRPLSETVSSGSRMDPYYLLMRLPREEREAFVLLQPFSPPSRTDLGNLLAFMVAKSDPGEYGELVAFNMPSGEQVFGPTQVHAQISGTPEIAREISLLGQRGSNVIFGSLQLIPIEHSILYVRPLYVLAEGRTQFPQLQRVMAFYGGNATMAPTLEQALAELFEGFETPEQPPPDDGDDEPGPQPGRDPRLDEIARLYAEAQEALRQGDLATYQDRFQRIGEIVGAVQADQEAADEAAADDTGDEAGDTAETTTTTTAPANA
ncbi:MAG TPA: UPF0182 family protein [Acidimicrobiia bacterium]|nr:UPF0182 family protein [Acidimicrobiia bacterium]